MEEGIRVRDPIHNFIRLTEEEVKLLATPLLQRLRRVRQLALASMVYPGALHTRFDHTLGVCHVAGLMAEQLNLGNDQRRMVRLAALLHDLGHGPFSHVSENVLERYANREAISTDQKKEKIHELVTAYLIANDEDIVHIASQDMCDRIVKLLSHGYGEPVLRSIVSGPLDADKQDYLLRDTYFCGVPYGVFDPHQLHGSFTLVGAEDEKDLAIEPDGARALEQFVLAKYYLTANVYRHHVRLITDQMIVRAIVLGIDEDKIDELREIYAFDNSVAFFQRYIGWDDAQLMSKFGAAQPDTLCGQLLNRLESRQLHKRVYSKRLQDFPDAEIRAKLLAINKPENDELRSRIEEAIPPLLKQHFKEQLNIDVDVDKRLVILNGFNIQSVRATSRNDESSIIIATEPEPTPFEDYSALFQSIKEGYADGSVEVYAPVMWETRSDRRKVRNKLRDPIHEVILELTTSALEHEKSLVEDAEVIEATTDAEAVPEKKVTTEKS